MSNSNRSASAHSAISAHATHAGLPNDADTETKIAELLKSLRLLCTEYNVDFHSASLLSSEKVASKERLTDHDETLQKYIDRDCSSCLKCGSDNLTSEEFSTDAGTADQTVHCEVCGHKWVDIYTFSDIQQ